MTVTDRARPFRLSIPLPKPKVLGALAFAGVLAACSSPEPAPPPPAPTPVAVVPQVSLSPKVVEQASAYRAYVARAAAISPAFVGGGGEVAQALKAGEAYEPQALLRGAIAYGAVVALQDPEFVAGVRKYAGDPEQRRTVAYEVMKDPAYAVGFAGSSGAAGLVIAALSDDGQKLFDLGKSVKQAAYDVQRQPWSKGEVSGREGRLALAKELSSTPGLGEIAETARLQQAVTGGAQMGLAGPAAAPPYSPVVIHSLAIAALAALGYADEASLGQVMPMLAEPNSATCLNMSKLNLYQCLAVSKPHYEDVFCLGQHVLMDTGRCLLKGAGAADPVPAFVPAEPKVTPVSTGQTVKSRAKRR